MQRGLIDTDLFLLNPNVLVIGMCSALLATGAWLQIASYFGWPVSTTHAIVGAIVGFGAVIGGVEAIQWGSFLSIIISWIASPVLSAFISYLIFYTLQRKILFALNPTEATKTFYPFLVFLVFFVFSLSLLFNGLENLNIHLSLAQTIGTALLVGLIAGFIAYIIVQKIKTPNTYPFPTSLRPQNIVSLEKAAKHLQRVRTSTCEETHTKVSSLLSEVTSLSHRMKKESKFLEKDSDYKLVEKMFVYLQIFSACFVAFAHGANDVANAIGPVAAVLDIIKNGAISNVAAVPSWLLAFGGVGIVIGLATWGWRVIETIGKKITELTPTRGFCAEFGAATTILIASKLGLPISTTHCLVGAVLGIGLARGMRALNLGMIKEIILSWVITIPASAGMSIGIFYIFKFFLL
jgi:phosphate/sulfate permease